MQLRAARRTLADDDQTECCTPRKAPGRAGRGRRYCSAVDVPVQFFQSTIAIELAVAGALLWEIRYFDREGAAGATGRSFPTRVRFALDDPLLAVRGLA